MTSPACTHDTFEFACRATVIEQPEAFTFVEVNVRCAACEVRFHWRGLSAATPNPFEPSVTADGFTLYAPISSGPGAIVGLLEKTGLGDQLVDPARLKHAPN